MSTKNRVFSPEFKEGVVQRIRNGESVSALRRELGIKRSVLYRWRDAYQQEGLAGLSRSTGRPPGTASGSGRAGQRQPPATPRPALQSPEEAAARRIAELERKIGQQAMDLDFLRRAFKRVKESRRKNTASGGTASTERSEA